MSIEWNKVTWYSKLLAGVLFAVVFGVGYWFGVNFKAIESVEIKNIPTVPLDLLTFRVYRSDVFGFELILPPDWTQYYAEKNEKGISFDLPLLNTPGEDRWRGVWRINITPLEKWKANMCEGVEGPCYQGTELGRNDLFVFESGYVSPAAGSDCVDEDFKKSEPYFCSVFYKAREITPGDFKFIQ